MAVMCGGFGAVEKYWRFAFALRRKDKEPMKVEDARWLFEKIEELAEINCIEVAGGVSPPERETRMGPPELD